MHSPADNINYPAISRRAAQANRRREVSFRLRALPCLADVEEAIRDGLSDSAISRMIHERGLLQDLSIDALRKQVSRYRSKVMRPADVASKHLPQVIARAAAEVRRDTDDLIAIHELRDELRQVIAKLRGFIEDSLDRFEADPAQGLRVLSTPLMQNYLDVLESLRKTTVASAQLKVLLGVTGKRPPRFAGSVPRRPPPPRSVRVGRADAYATLDDPAKMKMLTEVLVPALRAELAGRERRRGAEGDDDSPAQRSGVPPTPSEVPE